LAGTGLHVPAALQTSHDPLHGELQQIPSGEQKLPDVHPAFVLHGPPGPDGGGLASSS
jgi:hypothetical protein